MTTSIPAHGEPRLRTGLYGDIASADERVSHQWRVLCLDAKNGTILWQHTSTEGIPRIKRHPKSSHANSTPATDGRRYALENRTYKIIADGVEREMLRVFAGEDLAVPISQIPRTIRRAREIGRETGVTVIFYGHFGDGNVHSAILIDPSDADEVRRADELADRLHRLAIDVGGTVTGEHGTGAVRQPYMRAEHGDALDLMRRIKDVLDPKGILNPGKIYGR